MIENILETIIDTAKIIPYLFLVYIFLEIIQNKIKSFDVEKMKSNIFAPIVASLLGCIPQCGFSTAASSLYVNNLIKSGTLISVFLSTSDEAIPVLISSNENRFLIAYVIIAKVLISIIAGYILNYTIFKNEKFETTEKMNIDFNSCECNAHHNKENVKIMGILKNALYHTIKISVYILITLVIIDLIIYFIGDENFSKILFKGNKIIQPFISALIGVIPGCSISVLISELLIEKQILFGSAIAGLCTNAGFGYVIIIKNLGIKKSMKIIFIVYIFASIFGLILNLVVNI